MGRRPRKFNGFCSHSRQKMDAHCQEGVWSSMDFFNKGVTFSVRIRSGNRLFSADQSVKEGRYSVFCGAGPPVSELPAGGEVA